MVIHNFQQLGSFLILAFVDSKKYSEFQQSHMNMRLNGHLPLLLLSFFLDSVSLLRCGGSFFLLKDK